MVADLPNGVPQGRKVGVGEKCELRNTKEIFNKRGRLQKVADEEHGTKDEPGENSAYALDVLRTYDRKDDLQDVEVSINSPHILKALREIIGVDARWQASFEKPVTSMKPFAELAYYWTELAAYRDALRDEEARRHFELLFDFLEEEVGDTRRWHEAVLQKGQASFNQLWQIFRPGELLVTEHQGQPWLLRLRSTEYRENKADGRLFLVHAYYTDHDGTKLGRAYIPFSIFQRGYFPGDCHSRMHELPVYPLKFHPKRDTLEAELEERGKRYLELTGVHLKYYSGSASFLKGSSVKPADQKVDDDGDDNVFVFYKENGRVILDRKTYHEDINQIDVEDPAMIDGRPEDPELKLLPPFVYGYSLTRKFWCRFHIVNIHETKFDENAFDFLVLEDTQKLVLRALVMSNGMKREVDAETNEETKGLVVMLHGPTGTGKTLTAESAAEIKKKPLFTTTIRDLMKNGPAWFEAHLRRILRYAKAWGAIVLLEEADEFLEAVLNRTVFETVEAAFLRQLETFPGILFLTTNRLKAFDPSMLSRVDLSLEFKPAGRELRRELWLTHLRRYELPESEVHPESAAEELNADPMDGREIANTVANARTLARYEGKPLQLRHLKSVLAVRAKFATSIRREKDALHLQPTRETHLYM